MPPKSGAKGQRDYQTFLVSDARSFVGTPKSASEDLFVKDLCKELEVPDWKAAAQLLAALKGKFIEGNYWKPPTLATITNPLKKVLIALDDERNELELALALRSRQRFPNAHFEDAAEALQLLRWSLNSVLDRAQFLREPSKRSKAFKRNQRRIDKHAASVFVFGLADIWKATTGKEATQDWENGEPVSKSARFISAVVEEFEPKWRSLLPEVTKELVRHRSKASATQIA